MSGGKKVVESLWFTNLIGSAGIVVFEDRETGERKAYAGAVLGVDERLDTDFLIDWGTKLSLETLASIQRLLTKGVSAGGAQGSSEKSPER